MTHDNARHMTCRALLYSCNVKPLDTNAAMCYIHIVERDNITNGATQS